MALAEDIEALPAGITAVAIDKDKNSQYAVKWAIDHLTTSTKVLFLVHVEKTRRYLSLFFPLYSDIECDANIRWT